MIHKFILSAFAHGIAPAQDGISLTSSSHPNTGNIPKTGKGSRPRFLGTKKKRKECLEIIKIDVEEEL